MEKSVNKNPGFNISKKNCVTNFCLVAPPIKKIRKKKDLNISVVSPRQQ